jgi:hypothetical protein
MAKVTPITKHYQHFLADQRGLCLFVLPPRSPKLNGAVERANRNHAEESY